MNLENLYRDVSVRIKVRSAVQATQVTKAQGLYSRFEDFC